MALVVDRLTKTYAGKTAVDHVSCTFCGYGKYDRQYDAMRKCNGTGACGKTGGCHRIRREAVLEVSLLCESASNSVACSN